MSATATPLPITAERAPMRAPWLRVALYAVRRRQRATLAWGVPLGALAAMVIAIFPSISASPELSKLIESYPESLKQTFGITDAFFSSPEGYLAGELFNLIAPLACSFFVLHAIAAALAGADQRGTLDVVISAPIRRRHYAAGWLLGLAIVLLAILGVLALVMQASALVFGVDLPLGHTLAGALNLWPLGIFAGGLTILLCGVMDGSGAVTGAAGGVLVAMYFVEILGRVSDTVGRIDGISAFHYYGSAIEDGLDPGAFLGLTAAGLVLAAAGCLLFERRDLRR